MREIHIETKRLILTPRTVEEMQALRNNEENPEMVQAFTELIIAMNALGECAEWGSNWKIALHDGTIVGGICFKGGPNGDGDVEIGYGTEDGFEGNGYMTEAVGALTDWALKQDGVTCVRAETLPENLASQRVLLKNGFIRCENGYEGFVFRKRHDSGAPLSY